VNDGNPFGNFFVLWVFGLIGALVAAGLVAVLIARQTTGAHRPRDVALAFIVVVGAAAVAQAVLRLAQGALNRNDVLWACAFAPISYLALRMLRRRRPTA
jgi:hypothetical protein